MSLDQTPPCLWNYDSFFLHYAALFNWLYLVRRAMHFCVFLNLFTSLPLYPSLLFWTTLRLVRFYHGTTIWLRFPLLTFVSRVEGPCFIPYSPGTLPLVSSCALVQVEFERRTNNYWRVRETRKLSADKAQLESKFSVVRLSLVASIAQRCILKVYIGFECWYRFSIAFRTATASAKKKQRTNIVLLPKNELCV